MLKRLILAILILALLLAIKLAFPPSEHSRTEAAVFFGLEREKIQAIGKSLTEPNQATRQEKEAP